VLFLFFSSWENILSEHQSEQTCQEEQAVVLTELGLVLSSWMNGCILRFLSHDNDALFFNRRTQITSNNRKALQIPIT
jgi:hypothetical protein